MNITTLLDKVYFAPRLKKIDFYANRAGELQHRVLDRLVRMAENTEWGKKYDYKSIHTYEDFRNRLPIQTYALGFKLLHLYSLRRHSTL